MKTVVFSFCKYNKFVFGDQVVSQFVLFEHKRLFSVIFFYFHKSSGIQDRFHTHAFNAFSVKIFGRYFEYILDDEKTGDFHVNVRKNVFQFFPRNSYHKIGNSNGCATVLFSGKWKDGWKEKLDSGEIIEYKWGRKA